MVELAADKHVQYTVSVEKKKDAFESVAMEHLRMIGAYWGLTTLDLEGKFQVVDQDEVISWVMECQHESGAREELFADAPLIPLVDLVAILDMIHMYIILSVQLLALFGKLDILDVAKVCYSWWVLSSLIMIGRAHWIDKEKLARFILDCQDPEKGGISDRPDDAVDVFHTYFGVAGLSILQYPGVKAVDPAYVLPVDVVNKILIGL